MYYETQSNKPTVYRQYNNNTLDSQISFHFYSSYSEQLTVFRYNEKQKKLYEQYNINHLRENLPSRSPSRSQLASSHKT
jgi:hypothetical protein